MAQITSERVGRCNNQTHSAGQCEVDPEAPAQVPRPLINQRCLDLTRRRLIGNLNGRGPRALHDSGGHLAAAQEQGHELGLAGGAGLGEHLLEL